jgi:RNA polymerase sigma factor (sigma-70 family)
LDTTRPSLLLRIRDRADAAAWRTFDAIYRPMLHRFALACGLNEADAEDVVQHCMAAVQEKIGAFDYDPEKGRFKAWLRTLVQNRVRNVIRDRRDRAAPEGAIDGLESRDPSPEAVFDRLWMQEHLWHCLELVRQEVEEPTYLAFKRYVLDQHPIEEVCKELNMRANLVYTIKWRLTEKVAERMHELLGEAEAPS